MEAKTSEAVFAPDVWFPVDNAANLYSAAKRRNWARTLRLAFILNEPVNPELLQRALDDTLVRIPTFSAIVKSGMFWNYFERTNARATVQKETATPGRPINTGSTMQPNFRILYYKNRVALEVFHGMTDGGGSIRFLTSLIARYYELQGEALSDAPHLLRFGDEPTDEEMKDPYLRNSVEGISAKNYKEVEAFRIREPLTLNAMRVTHGICRVEDVKRAAGAYALTLTEYLTAVLIQTYLQTTPVVIDKPVSVSIPLDLRRRFGTQSMRNFCYMSDIAFDPQGRRDVPFGEICEAIAGTVQSKATLEYLTQEISQNVRAQSSPLLRPVPYPLKRVFLLNTYRKNQNSFTTFLSNIGEVLAPPEVLRHINHAEFTLGETPYNPFGVGIVSVNGLLTITFNDCRDDMEKQRFFFRFLTSQGVPVRVESNRK